MDSELQISSPRLASMSIGDESNLSQLNPFDVGSHTFIPYRPPAAETRPRNANARNGYIPPSRPGEPVHEFMVATQPTHQQNQPRQSGNEASSHFKPQGRFPNQSGLQQSREYNNDFENGQLGNIQSTHMRRAFPGSGSAQISPPASLSQNNLAMVNHPQAHSNSFAMLPSPVQPFQSDIIQMEPESVDPSTFSGPGELRGFKVIPDPPHLDYWRERLFNVDEMITLSEDEYVTLCIALCLSFIISLLQKRLTCKYSALQIQYLLPSC
jgi:glutathione S-transferase